MIISALLLIGTFVHRVSRKLVFLETPQLLTSFQHRQVVGIENSLEPIFRDCTKTSKYMVQDFQGLY